MQNVEIISEDGPQVIYYGELGYEKMREFVGGPIEYVPMPANCLYDVIVNEEGHYLNLQYNPRATDFVRRAWLEEHDASEINFDMLVIMGPAIIVRRASEQ